MMLNLISYRDMGKKNLKDETRLIKYKDLFKYN